MSPTMEDVWSLPPPPLLVGAQPSWEVKCSLRVPQAAAGAAAKAGDALLPGERSMAALTDVFSGGLQRIRHSSRAVIYLSCLRHGPP